MKIHSCGAILYTSFNNDIYIILGMEKGMWFPFKGTREIGETCAEAAIREIYEETCSIVKLDDIELNCQYSTKRKYYHIGLVYVNHNIIQQFYTNRSDILVDSTIKNKNIFLEKSDIKLFKFDDIKNNKFHSITKIPILFYYDKLSNIQNSIRTKPIKEISCF